jgi:hypothetical protein
MGKLARIAALAASVVVVLAVLQGSALKASADDGPRTLTFHVLFSPFSFTDVGDPGPSAGDMIVFHDQLQQQGKTVGDDVGSCVLVEVTDTGPLANCTGVVQLTDRGTITFAFVNAPPPHKVLAITGGSGQFSTTRGDGTLDENQDQTGTLVLRLRR